MYANIITIAITITCGLSLLACDPSEPEFDEDLDASSESSAEEASESLDDPGDAPDLGTLDEHPCNDELELEAAEAEEQTVWLCFVNGAAGSTKWTTTVDEWADPKQCCGVAAFFKKKHKIKVELCCVGENCTPTGKVEESYPCSSTPCAW